MSIWTRIKGGWKTWGPNAIIGDGAFSSDSSQLYDSVTADMALRLSAVWACMHLRAETIGSLPLHLRDKQKNVITDHPLYSILHNAPNSMQTAPEYWSMATAHVDMHGNHLSEIKRRNNGTVISLEPFFEPDTWTPEQEKNGKWFYKNADGTRIAAENMLHLRGFSMRGNWGLPRLEIGRHILAAQLTANDSAVRAFKQGLKVGGFFEITGNGPDLDGTKLQAFRNRLDDFGKPENNGKWMTLLKGMKPIGGADFRVKPADAELLASRGFGIEEICRLMNTPPQLIGHSDKASSWASSLEQINLFFLTYGLVPTLVRNERTIAMRLLSHDDRARGREAKWSTGGLLRADLKSRREFYASGLQNGYLNINEVRDLEERQGIGEQGDEYRIQMNMTADTDGNGTNGKGE